MSAPLISVVMSVYKEPIDWLRQSIDSILQQTYRNIEYIVVCDNPEYKDGILLLREYEEKDCRVKLIFNSENIGLTKSLNKGLAISHGEYIARMDADDISTPNRFEEQLAYFKLFPDTDVCHTDYVYINKGGEIISRKKIFPYTPESDLLFWYNVVAHPTVMFNRRILSIRAPMYNESIKVAQDYELWTTLFLHGKVFGYLDKKLIKYRISSNQISTKKIEVQYNNTLKIRQTLIIHYLKNYNISIKNNNVEDCVNEIQRFLRNSLEVKPIEYKCMLRILYLMYNTLATNSIVYAIRFILSKDFRILSLSLKDKCRILITPIIKRKNDSMRF